MKHNNFRTNLRGPALAWSIFLTCLMLCSSAHAQTKSLRIDKGPLEDAITQIRNSFNIVIAYTEDDIRNVSVQAAVFENKTVEHVLTTVLKGTSLTFLKNGSSYILQKKKSPNESAGLHPGNIKGRILDAETSEALPGASIRITELAAEGTVSDANGDFKFMRVPAGTYTVRASFIGYSAYEQSITIEDGLELALTIPLTPSSDALDEVVIVGSVDVRYTPIVNSGEKSLISDIREASNIVSGISNMQIARSMDRDGADVMRRVPGVTVLNSFVLVRGMDPRYNVTYLNNMLIPSTESDSRAFSFNLIPSGLIDDIKIYKAPAPELPGGFGGGVIKVNTKKSQATRHIQIDVSAQYRTGSSLADYYTGSSATPADRWGMGIKSRELPEAFRTNPIGLPDYEFYPAEYIARIRSLPEVNNVQQGRHSFDRRLGINYYDSYKIGSVRISNLTAAGYTYQRTNEFRSRATQGVQNWIMNAEGKPDYFLPNDQSLDSIFSENVRLSLLENLEIKINDKHRIGFNVFANRNAENNTLLSAEVHTGGNFNQGKPYPLTEQSFNELAGGITFRNAGFEYRVRDLVSGQLSGSHTLSEKLSVDWNVGQTTQTDYIPDWQTFNFRGAYQPGKYEWALTSNREDNNTRMRYLTEEKMKIAGADVSYTPLPFLTVKAGTLLQWANREFTNNNFNVMIPPNDNAVRDAYTNLYQPWFNIRKMYADENFREDGQGYNMMATFSALSYQFAQNIAAFYGAVRLRTPGKKFELYTGLRYENEYAQLFDFQGKAVTGIPGPNFTYYLPSANLTWNITEKHKLRTSFGKSIDRPAYRERSTAGYYSVREAVNYNGNPQLKNAEITNYDLRWEWYPSETEFIAIGGYYKFINNPIEMYEIGSSGFARLYRGWVNKRWAELYGVELEVRKSLAFIPGDFMKQFSVILNGSYMFTNVREDITLGEGKTIDTRLQRPLAGSSPYAFNAALFFEQAKTHTQVTAAYNYIGERIIVTSPSFVGNLHENPQHQLDLIIIQPIGKHVRLKGGVQNVLNLPIVRWRDGNLDGKYEPGIQKPASQLIDPGLTANSDHEAERWKPGAYYSFGITLTL